MFQEPFPCNVVQKASIHLDHISHIKSIYQYSPWYLWWFHPCFWETHCTSLYIKVYYKYTLKFTLNKKRNFVFVFLSLVAHEKPIIDLNGFRARPYLGHVPMLRFFRRSHILESLVLQVRKLMLHYGLSFTFWFLNFKKWSYREGKKVGTMHVHSLLLNQQTRGVGGRNLALKYVRV